MLTWTSWQRNFRLPPAHELLVVDAEEETDGEEGEQAPVEHLRHQDYHQSVHWKKKSIIFFIFIMIFIRATRYTTSWYSEEKKIESVMIRLLSRIFSFSFAPRGLPRDGPPGRKRSKNFRRLRPPSPESFRTHLSVVSDCGTMSCRWS